MFHGFLGLLHITLPVVAPVLSSGAGPSASGMATQITVARTGRRSSSPAETRPSPSQGGRQWPGRLVQTEVGPACYHSSCSHGVMLKSSDYFLTLVVRPVLRQVLGQEVVTLVPLQVPHSKQFSVRHKQDQMLHRAEDQHLLVVCPLLLQVLGLPHGHLLRA